MSVATIRHHYITEDRRGYKHLPIFNLPWLYNCKLFQGTLHPEMHQPDHFYSELYISYTETSICKTHNLKLNEKELQLLLTSVILNLIKIETLFVDESISREDNPFVKALLLNVTLKCNVMFL